MCSAPAISCSIFSLFCNLFTVAELFKCAFSPLSLVYAVFFIAIIILIQKWVISKYSSYDGSESSCDSLNNLHPLVISSFITILIINALGYPFVFASAAVKYNVTTFSLTAFLNASIGSKDNIRSAPPS